MPVTKVVILNWNGSAHLRTFLPSVIRTTPSDIGIVVADNGSTDDSRNVIRLEFPSVELLELDANYGFAGGYNRALSRIEADYFILLNSDVATTEGWCEPLVAALDNNLSLAAVQPKIRAYTSPDNFEYAGACGGFIDALGYPFCRGRILQCVETDNGQYDISRRCFWASGACMACRSEAFFRTGGFDEDFFAHMEEIDFCWRAQLAGFSVEVVPESRVWHLGGGSLPQSSPFKLKLNFRNSLLMLDNNLAATLGPRKAGRVIRMRHVLDFCAAAVYLLSGRPACCRAVRDAYAEYRKLRAGGREGVAGRDMEVCGAPAGVRGMLPLGIIFQSALHGKGIFEFLRRYEDYH